MCIRKKNFHVSCTWYKSWSKYFWTSRWNRHCCNQNVQLPNLHFQNGILNFGSLCILVGNVKSFDHLISNIAIFLNRQQKYEKEPDFWLTTKIIKLQDYETEFRRTVWKRKEYLIKVEVSWEGHRNLKKIFT